MEESRQIEITVLGWAFNQVGKMPISPVSVPELKPRLCFGFWLPVNVQCWREKVMVHLLDLSPSEETCTESSVRFNLAWSWLLGTFGERWESLVYLSFCLS